MALGVKNKWVIQLLRLGCVNELLCELFVFSPYSSEKTRSDGLGLWGKQSRASVVKLHGSAALGMGRRTARICKPPWWYQANLKVWELGRKMKRFRFISWKKGIANDKWGKRGDRGAKQIGNEGKGLGLEVKRFVMTAWLSPMTRVGLNCSLGVGFAVRPGPGVLPPSPCGT